MTEIRTVLRARIAVRTFATLPDVSSVHDARRNSHSRFLVQVQNYGSIVWSLMPRGTVLRAAILSNTRVRDFLLNFCSASLWFSPSTFLHIPGPEEQISVHRCSWCLDFEVLLYVLKSFHCSNSVSIPLSLSQSKFKRNSLFRNFLRQSKRVWLRIPDSLGLFCGRCLHTLFGFRKDQARQETLRRSRTSKRCRPAIKGMWWNW